MICNYSSVNARRGRKKGVGQDGHRQWEDCHIMPIALQTCLSIFWSCRSWKNEIHIYLPSTVWAERTKLPHWGPKIKTKTKKEKTHLGSIFVQRRVQCKSHKVGSPILTWIVEWRENTEIYQKERKKKDIPKDNNTHQTHLKPQHFPTSSPSVKSWSVPTYSSNSPRKLW